MVGDCISTATQIDNKCIVETITSSNFNTIIFKNEKISCESEIILKNLKTPHIIMICRMGVCVETCLENLLLRFCIITNPEI